MAGVVGFAGIPAYVASKHGVVGLTKNAALDYAEAGVSTEASSPVDGRRVRGGPWPVSPASGTFDPSPVPVGARRLSVIDVRGVARRVVGGRRRPSW